MSISHHDHFLYSTWEVDLDTTSHDDNDVNKSCPFVMIVVGKIIYLVINPFIV